MAFLLAAVIVMATVAVRRRAFVGWRDAWRAQTGLGSPESAEAARAATEAIGTPEDGATVEGTVTACAATDAPASSTDKGALTASAADMMAAEEPPEVARANGAPAGDRGAAPADGAEQAAQPSAGIWASLGCAVLLVFLYDERGYHWVPWVVAVMVAYWAFVRFAERRRCYELRGGLPALAVLLAGLAGGAALAVPMAIQPAATPQAPVFELGALSVLGAAYWVLCALCEEIVWRGLTLRVLESRIGSGLALLVTAFGFAAWHERWSVFSIIDLALAGGMFGAAFLLTRRLWLPVGLHAGWNITIDAIPGPSSWLGAILVMAAQCTIITLFLVFARRRGHLTRRPWAKQRRVAAKPGLPAPAILPSSRGAAPTWPTAPPPSPPSSSPTLTEVLIQSSMQALPPAAPAPAIPPSSASGSGVPSAPPAPLPEAPPP